MKLYIALASLLTLGSAAACLADTPAASAAATQPAGATTAATAAAETLPAGLQPCVEPREEGRIDWTEGAIYAIGVSKAHGRSSQEIAMAKRAASLVAARNAILMISNVRVDVAGRYGQIRGGTLSIDAVLRDYQEVSSDFNSENKRAKVVLKVPLYGASGVVRLTGITVDRGLGSWQWPVPPAGAAKVEQIIVDARKTAFVPCLFPRLQTARGQRVLDAGQFTSQQDQQRQVITVACLAKQPKGEKKSPATEPEALMERPGVLVLHPAGVADVLPGAIVLSQDDLDKLASTAGAKEAMMSGRVTVVVDKSK